MHEPFCSKERKCLLRTCWIIRLYKPGGLNGPNGYHGHEIPEDSSTRMAQTLTGADAHLAEDQSHGRALDVAIIFVAVVLCGVVYASTLRAGFIFDDHILIVRNDFIKDSRLLMQAMVSDVAAFKGDRGQAWSSYWRPAFIAWYALNYRLFGLNPIGWHAGALTIFAATVAAAYGVARGLRLARPIAASVVLVYAVHPALVECVAFVTGANTVFMALPLLGAWWLALKTQVRSTPLRWVAACVLYAVALLSKEAAIVFPALVFASVGLVYRLDQPPPKRWIAAARTAAPFALLALAYFIARWLVLGGLVTQAPWQRGMLSSVNTAPAVLAFYLREMMLPLWVGPAHSLRPVSAIGVMTFLVPGALVIIAGALMWRAAHRSPAVQVGLALLVIPLLPVLHTGVFPPEYIVNDRHAFLSLLGFLIIAFTALDTVLVRNAGWTRPAAHRACLAAAAALCIPLAIKSALYTRAYASGQTFWEESVRSDPTSAFALTQYGRILKDQTRYDDAVAVFDRALTIAPLSTAYLLRAETRIEQRQFAQAEDDLRHVLKLDPADFAAYERLAICFERQRRLMDAVHTLREARTNIPYRKCLLTDRIAVVLYQAGKPDQAIAELESVRGDVGREFGEMSRLALYRLGVLYLERGRQSDGVSALRQFMELSAAAVSAEVLASRDQTRQILAALGSL